MQGTPFHGVYMNIRFLRKVEISFGERRIPRLHCVALGMTMNKKKVRSLSVVEGSVVEGERSRRERSRWISPQGRN